MDKINVRIAFFFMVVLLSIVVCEKVVEGDCGDEKFCGTCKKLKVVYPNEDNDKVFTITCTECSKNSPNGKEITIEEIKSRNKSLGKLSCTKLLTRDIIGTVLGVAPLFILIGGGVFAYYKCRDMNRGNNMI